MYILAFQKRAQKLFSAIVIYSFELIYADVEEIKILKKCDDDYCVLLYNDEIHTYDQVEEMLNKTVNANKEEAKNYAHMVDISGRTLLKRGTKSECQKIQNQVTILTKDETNFQRDRRFKPLPLKTLVVDIKIIALQEIAISLLQWMNW